MSSPWLHCFEHGGSARLHAPLGEVACVFGLHPVMVAAQPMRVPCGVREALVDGKMACDGARCVWSLGLRTLFSYYNYCLPILPLYPGKVYIPVPGTIGSQKGISRNEPRTIMASTPVIADGSSLLTTTLECIALERDAEREECCLLADSVPVAEQQRRGVALFRLHVASSETALFGRVQLTLQLSAGRPLPPTKLSIGAMVGLRSSSAQAATAATGTVTAVRASSLSVTFEEMPEESQLVEPLTLSLLYNDVTYRRLEAALGAVRSDKAPVAASELCRALLGSTEVAAAAMARCAAAGAAAEPLGEHCVYNRGLNEGQRRAIGFALAARPVALIHGPPGTGKTTAVVELIRQAIARGERVLASAASNVAVDNMAERLLAGGGAGRSSGVRLVRVGHPARLLPSVVEASLDARLAGSDGGAIVRDVKADLASAREKLRRERAKGGRAALKAEVSTLRRELVERQRRSVRDVLIGAQVVLCTNTGAADRALGCLPDDFAFDLVVIDEAAQALEASCWVALLRGRRAVLAGDHLQLPPVGERMLA